MAAEKTPEEMHEEFLHRAIIQLENGGSELTIINSLTGMGVSPDAAKPLARRIYGEARALVYRKRLPLIILGWLFIAAGVFLPVLVLVQGGQVFGVFFVAVAPMAFGFGLLQKARVR